MSDSEKLRAASGRVERRFLSVEQQEVEFRVQRRAAGDEGERQDTHIVYTAPPWMTWSRDLGGFIERFERGAFANLSDDGFDIISSFEHDRRLLLGRSTSGTLSLTDKRGGLESDVLMPETRADVVELIERKDVKGASFEFSLLDPEGDEWREGEDGRLERTIRAGAAWLFQTGPVVNPAYDDSPDVAMRSLVAWQEERGIHKVPPGMSPVYYERLRQDVLELTLG